MATFNWAPSYTPTQTKRPRVLAAQFGDGYEQRVTDGINANLSSWQLAFNNRSIAEAADIEAFLDARAGAESFDWTPPSGAAGKFVCREWTRTRVTPVHESIAATFVQVAA